MSLNGVDKNKARSRDEDVDALLDELESETTTTLSLSAPPGGARPKERPNGSATSQCEDDGTEVPEIAAPDSRDPPDVVMEAREHNHQENRSRQIDKSKIFQAATMLIHSG